MTNRVAEFAAAEADFGADRLATWAPCPPVQRRRYRRWITDFSLALEVEGVPHLCTASDISPGGACLHLVTPSRVPVGTAAVLQAEGCGKITANVRRSDFELLGVKFKLADAARLEFSNWLLEDPPKRARDRCECRMEAVVLLAEGERSCEVANISNWGAGIRLADPVAPCVGKNLVLLLADRAPIAAAIRHSSQAIVGLSFLDALRQGLPVQEAVAGE